MMMEQLPKSCAYVLIEAAQLEQLVKTHFILNQSVLLFEYLLRQSDYPMFLSAQSACEVLGIKPDVLEQCRRQRIIRPRIYQRQFLYSAYDLVTLSFKLNQKRLLRLLRKAPHVSAADK